LLPKPQENIYDKELDSVVNVLLFLEHFQQLSQATSFTPLRDSVSNEFINSSLRLPQLNLSKNFMLKFAAAAAKEPETFSRTFPRFIIAV
jgi:hypothetical protein